jgi:sensor histidine kinase YesM
MPAPAGLFQSTKPSRIPLFWQLQLAGWLAFAVFLLPLKRVVYGTMTGSLLITVYQLPLSLLLSAAMRSFFRQITAKPRAQWQTALLVLAACASASSVDVLVSIPVNHSFGLYGPADILGIGLYFFRTAVYLIWSLLYFMIKGQMAARQQAFHAAVAQEKFRLENLRYRLKPQFLAHSLEEITDEIDQNPAVARAMTLRLTHFYRTTLRHAEHEESATLGEELELVRAYLELQRLRLGDGLSVRYEVDETLLPLSLPPLLLLPLAERAVQYGLRALPTEFEIRVTAQRTPEGDILLEVARTGRLADVPESEDPAGAELLNLRTRLERYYPGRHRFVFTQDSTRVRATLSLPPGG